MTDADIQADIQRMVEEAETGTTMRPQDGQETDPIQARRNKDAEEAARKEYEERQKAREAEGDPFEGAPEFQEGEEMGQIEEYNKYLDATRDAEAYEKYKAATEEYEETADYEKYKAATEQYEDIEPYLYEPGQTPKQDVSDLADELAEEMGTPLPDDVPTSPNIMTEEEWNSLEPGLKGGGEAEMIGEIGGEAVAMDEGLTTAAKIATAAKVGQTGVEMSREAASMARAIEAAEMGEEALVATEIMSGLAASQAAAAGAVLVAGAEIAALTAVTYGAEKLFDKASGKVERPDSLDGAAHELTPTERAYFQQFTDKQVKDAQVARGANVDPTQLRRQPNSPFAAKGSGVTPGSGPGGQRTPLSIARDRDLYIEMSDAEKKVWDDNYNKTIDNENTALNYWNNLPEGTMIQNGVDGYVILPPPTLSGGLHPKPGTPQSWIDDFNNQLNNNGINKQQDGIGNLETMAQEEAATAQAQKDAEMEEVYAYLEYMDQQNEAYLASVGLLETQPEPEIPNIRIGKADITPLPQPQARPRAPMPNYKPDNA